MALPTAGHLKQGLDLIRLTLPLRERFFSVGYFISMSSDTTVQLSSKQTYNTKTLTTLEEFKQVWGTKEGKLQVVSQEITKDLILLVENPDSAGTGAVVSHHLCRVY